MLEIHSQHIKRIVVQNAYYGIGLAIASCFCLFVAMVASGCAGNLVLRRDGVKPADMVVMNGRILTSDIRNPHAEAMAVKDGRITYIGSHAGLHEFIGHDTRVINARKRRITPGFIDSHCHVLWIGALLHLMPDNLFACESFDDIQKALLRWSETHPGHPFVGGIGWLEFKRTARFHLASLDFTGLFNAFHQVFKSSFFILNLPLLFCSGSFAAQASDHPERS